MKSLIALFIYVGTFMAVFFALSLVGLLWADDYYSIVATQQWFILYSIFIGWWVSLLPTREYYMHHQKYFEDYL